MSSAAAKAPSPGSRLPGFYRYPLSERLRLLFERGVISEADYHTLAAGSHILGADEADKLVENAIGVFGLPMGVGLNFRINERDYVVPLVVEEPSILAALSSAAKAARQEGGFRTTSTNPILIGQIQVVDVRHVSTARNKLQQQEQDLLDLANSLHPKMVARGGGAKAIDVLIHPSSRGDMLVVHLLVDTRDAMGANLVNTMCEGVAPFVEKITGGKVFLRILSNLTDRAMVRAEATFSLEALAGNGYTGEQVRDGVILANDFAMVDPYRAATHNKGIMNGIDAVAIATGNDWRAIEAAAHAYAGRGSSYTSLTRWYEDEQGKLVGRLELPLKVGIVGGQVQSNRAVQIAHRLLGVGSATELAEVMGAVGLAQNFGALRALSTEGIQRGHMTLHARSVAIAAGASGSMFETVIEKLIESGEIKVWKAQQIMEELGAPAAAVPASTPASDDSAADEVAAATDEQGQLRAAGHGKVILLGEHAVVHGAHALAVPLELAVQARVRPAKRPGISLVIPRWGYEKSLRGEGEPSTSIQRSLALIVDKLGVADSDMIVEVFPHVPRAMGFGSSAALAVAVIRAVAQHHDLDIDDDRVNELAFQCETIAHGTASGIDNAMATYGQPLLFRRGDPPKMEPFSVSKPFSLVIGITGVESLTAKMVGKVREGWQRNNELYERLFSEVDRLSLDGLEAVKAGDFAQLGELMNVCQGMLNALGVSSWELEELVEIARGSGALGAKLTGGGGGGSMIALCPEDPEAPARIAHAMRQAGYRAMITRVGGAS